MKRIGLRRQFLLVVVLLAATLVFLSCGQPAQPAATPTAEKTTPAQPKATTAPQATPAAKAPELTVVKAGHMGASGDAYLYIALDKGYFKSEGIDLELTMIDSGAKMIPPMAAGQLDVGRGSPSPGLFNAIARGVPLKIVADMIRIAPTTKYFALVARKDLLDSGALKDYSDLKGKKVAVVGKAAGSEVELDFAAKKGNLSLDDMEVVELPFPNMTVALSNKAIDLALITEPFQTQGQEKGIFGLWKPANEFANNHQLAVLMYSPAFVQKPDVANRFMVAYSRGLRDFYDAFYKNKNRSEIVSILTKYTSTKDPAMFDKMDPQGVDPNGYVNAKSIMDDQDWYISKGYMKDKIAEKDLIDNQYIDYAIKQLGKYQ